MAERCGRQLHLPLWAASLAEASRAVRARRGEGLAVKPRHGSNGKYVALWPSGARVEELQESVVAAAGAQDPSWRRESWNQNAVVRGVVVQPLYAFMADLVQVEGPRMRRPLELKVQVLSGQVVGACLSSHPIYLWVTRCGAVILWDPKTPGLLKKGHGIWEALPLGVLELLRESLKRHWLHIRDFSEQVAYDLDELRVDWLLGDENWGPRIGELTYMGTMALDLAPVSQRLAKAFAANHLGRLQGVQLDPFGEMARLQA